jgi:hypothetical protein
MFVSGAEFWEQYKSPNGGKMGYQHILDALKAKREAKIRDSFRDDAEAARRYFDGNLAHQDANDAFKYKKNGKDRWYVKDKDIAIRWRRLLEANPDVKAKWEGMRDAER